jgi:hypothetical protein
MPTFTHRFPRAGGAGNGVRPKPALPGSLCQPPSPRAVVADTMISRLTDHPEVHIVDLFYGFDNGMDRDGDSQAVFLLTMRS